MKESRAINLDDCDPVRIAEQILAYGTLDAATIKMAVAEESLLCPGDLLSVVTGITMAASDGTALVIGKDFTGSIFLTLSGDLARPEALILDEAKRLIVAAARALEAGAVRITRPTK